MRTKLRATALSTTLLLALLPVDAPAGPEDTSRRAETVISGGAREQGIGYALAPAGDVNGDSIEDLIVRANRFWRDDTPVYVVFGGSTGRIAVDELGDQGFAISHSGPAETGDSRSYEMTGIAPLADLNSDGFDDVLVGVPGADYNSRENSGSVFVVFGKSDGYDVDLATSTTTLRIDGAGAGDELGTAVAAADLDGDPIPDVVLGAPYAGTERPRPGWVHVLLGASLNDGVDLAGDFAGYTLRGPVGRQKFGAAVAAAGDMDSDGFDEVVIGAPSSTFDVPSAAYVVYDRSDLDLESDDWHGFEVGGGNRKRRDEIGLAVTGGMDFSGDGVPDVLVGAPSFDDPQEHEGGAFVIFGSPERTDVNVRRPGSWGVAIHAPEYPAATGAAVAFAPDVNGDGRAEALVGSPSTYAFREYDAGRVDLIAGTDVTGTIDLHRAETLVTYVGNMFESVGAAVAFVRGFTGLDDGMLAIGAPGATVRRAYSAGKVYLVDDRPPANDLPPVATLYSYRARQRGRQGSYCWDGVCADSIPGIPRGEQAAIKDAAVIRFGIDVAPDDTTLARYSELDGLGRPAGDPRPVRHRVRPVDGRRRNGYEVVFRLPKRRGPVYLSLQARWEGEDRGDSTWFFHLDLDGQTYTPISSPPDAHLLTADVRQSAAIYSYSWSERYVDGTGSTLHSDAFRYGFPAGKPGRHGARAYIRIHDPHRPDRMVIRSYRRVERVGDPPFGSEYPAGPKKMIDFRWRTVRRDGRAVAHEARFRLPGRGRHAYIEARPSWRWHGTAPLQFHIRFVD